MKKCCLEKPWQCITAERATLHTLASTRVNTVSTHESPNPYPHTDRHLHTHTHTDDEGVHVVIDS